MRRLIVYLNASPVGTLDQDDSKNYSLIYPEGQRRLAPLYDLVCTLAWPELSTVPAMKIGGSGSIRAITRKHWQKMAEEAKISWPVLRQRISSLAERTLKLLASSGSHNDVTDSTASKEVAMVVGGQVSALLRNLK